MADRKYGRLYTEEDMRKLAARWLGDREMGPDIMVETLSDLDREGAFTFPADEPLFLLRASDHFAPFAVQDYVKMLSDEQEGDGEPVDRAQYERAQEVLAEMYAWRREHPDRVKEPDA